jgi:hypothetical protein
MTGNVRLAVSDPFDTYSDFFQWLVASYPERQSTTAKGTSFMDFVARLLPETSEGQRFGRLVANPKHSHDLGVDVVSADATTEQLALQSKFSISEKAHIDHIISQFENYEKKLDPDPEGQLFADDRPPPARPIYGIATASKLDGILAEYRKSKLSSRAFYDRLVENRRIVVWDGERLRREARQLNARHFERPVGLELASSAGRWLHDGRVWLGIVDGRALVRLEREHGPGLFFENVRGFLGLAGGRDGETVNQAIRNTVEGAPGEMLARNNGVTFRAAAVEPSEDGTTLLLRDASIINGRQTTGALSSVADVATDCRVQVKVVQAEQDAWDIADAANNQNRVARIELLLARYFRDQVVKRELASVVSGSDWLATVVDEDRERQENFELLRALLVGLFCHRPGQLAENNYSHIRFDVLDLFYENGEPPPILYPTLFAIATATNEAVDLASRMSDVDPLSQIAEQGRPKYRAFLALLTLSATHNIDVAAGLDDINAEVARKRDFIERSAELLEGDRPRFVRNFSLAYEIVGWEAHGAADEEGDAVRVQQKLSQSVFGTPFTTHLNRLRQSIKADAKRRELLG